MSSATNKVPMGQKIAFGVGMLANQMFPAAMGIFMVVLVQDLGFPGWMWGVIFFAPRAFDAILDPIMGYISDNTRSRWGRRRQYVFIGALIMGVSFACLWQLYRENSVAYNFTYVMLWSFVFYLGLTIFGVPYVSMGYEMSDDYHERTRLMAVAQWIGQWAWVIAPWFWIVLYDPDWFDSATEGARTLSIWVGSACMLLAMVPAIFCQSGANNAGVTTPHRKESLGAVVKELLHGIVITLRCKPFQQICIATFFIFNAYNTVAGFAWFIIVYYMNQGDPALAGVWPTLFGSVSALCTCFLVIPTINWMAQRYGKRLTFTVTQSISIVGYLLFWWSFDPSNPYLMFVPIPIFAFGIGGLFTIMMSMTADICDLDELQTGERREGLFGAIYWWMVKFGLAFAGLLSGFILAFIGFDQNVAIQSDNTLDQLRMAFICVPVTGTLIALWAMRGYELDEQAVEAVKASLSERRPDQADASAQLANA